MNFQENLFRNLMNLVEKNEAFFFKDFTLDSRIYRIFNYRLAAWSLFQEPDAINCRGSMFDVTESPVLVSLPPEKFFNYEEGGVNHSDLKIGVKMDKMDGSLMSTYIHEGSLNLKSKGSLFSTQAEMANKLLLRNEELFKELNNVALDGYTVNLEYTSPENRVVVPYQKEQLTILSVRCHKSGKSFIGSELKDFLLKSNLVTLNELVVNFDNTDNSYMTDDLLEKIRNETFGEGYVIQLLPNNSPSYLIKVKNLKYITLHQTKDTVNNTRALFEAIIDENTDDLRSLFHDDEYVLTKISLMENSIQPIYNHMVNLVESFYEKNGKLDRKDYAILAQNEHKMFMPLLMNIYLGKKVDYKDFSKKHREDLFGITELNDSSDDVPDLHKSSNIKRI